MVRSQGDAGPPRASPSTVRVFGQGLAVVGCVLGAKVWLVTRFHQHLDGFDLVDKVLAAGPDLLLAAVLVAALVGAAHLRHAPVRWGVQGLVVLALVANYVLAAVVVVGRSYFTIADPHPSLAENIGTIVLDYGTIWNVGGLVATAAAWWLIPWGVGRWLGTAPARVLPALRRWGPALVVFVAGYTLAGAVREKRDTIRTLSLARNPLAFYFSAPLLVGSFRHESPVPPATFTELADSLAPIAGADGVRETAAGIDVLRGERPNVILVVMESVGAGALDPASAPATGAEEAGGGAPSRPPFLSRMRTHAVSFRRYSTPVPLSRGALPSIFCSRFPVPKRYGGTPNGMLDRCRPLPRILEAHGVRTGFFMSSSFGDWMPRAFYEHFGFGVLRDASLVIRERTALGRPVDSHGGRLMEHETVSELLTWTREPCAARAPFFAVYYSYLAHAPYEAVYAEAGQIPDTLPAKERYHLLVEELEDQIVRLYEALAGRDCGRSTAVLVTGDHGEAFYEHMGNHYHAIYPYEENVRVPLLVIHPKLMDAVSDRVATHVDLAPTVLDLMLGDGGLAAASAPRATETDVAAGPVSLPYEGRSLLRSAPPWPAFSTTFFGDGFTSIRYGQFKLIAGLRGERLFDIDADPGETIDLRSRHPELAAAMDMAIARWATHERGR